MASEFSAEDPYDQPVNRGGRAGGGPVLCKRPGCGKPLPVPQGRGRTRQFCSNECARRYHNDARVPSARVPSARTPALDADDPLAALDSLIRQAGTLVRAALDQADKADGASILAQLAEAEAARLRAEALASAANARAIAAQQQVDALTEALAATREEARAAREELRRWGVRHGRLRPAGSLPGGSLPGGSLPVDHGTEEITREALSPR